jgi:hypothetical protein
MYGDNGNDLIFGDLGQDTMTGGDLNDTFTFDATEAGFNPSPVTAPDWITDFDALFGVDRLNLGAPGTETNFHNTGASVTTLAQAVAVADAALSGAVVYVTVNVETGIGPTTDNTAVFWDTDGDGDADEAIALLSTPQANFGADNII